MKATELMIRDWVNLSDVRDEIIPCKVVELRTDELFEIQPNDTACDIVGYDMIFPIPLTPEILEKNGFVNDSSYDECVADYHFVTVQIWSYSSENVLIQWDGITCEVINDFGNPCEKITLHGENYEHDIYVHELQHALRLCGLNDLADNFRVI